MITDRTSIKMPAACMQAGIFFASSLTALWHPILVETVSMSDRDGLYAPFQRSLKALETVSTGIKGRLNRA